MLKLRALLGDRALYDFHGALGQYIVYRNLIQLTEPEYKLYLAIDDVVYTNFFQRKSIQLITNENKLSLMVVEMEKEEILQWID
ncbi:MAG: element excision factor XisH family protein [Microcoleus sp.]|uniref:element excision factor XisH family protein n=1 Tax=Microcoleus sp. TaxID=44472 RepID=UPI003C71F52F